MSDKVRIKVFVNTGFSNARHEDYWEVGREEWEGLSQEDKEKLLDDYANDYMANCIEFGAYVEDEDEE